MIITQKVELVQPVQEKILPIKQTVEDTVK